MFDLSPAPAHAGKFRRDWGLQNMVGADAAPLFGGNDMVSMQNRNDFRQHKVRGKVANFISTAIYPQQLTIPRQYATTREGCWVYKILEGRRLRLSDSNATYREKGVRVVVQENARQARFVMSPLFGSKADALAWARQEMGAEL